MGAIDTIGAVSNLLLLLFLALLALFSFIALRDRRLPASGYHFALDNLIERNIF